MSSALSAEKIRMEGEFPTVLELKLFLNGGVAGALGAARPEVDQYASVLLHARYWLLVGGQSPEGAWYPEARDAAQGLRWALVPPEDLNRKRRLVYMPCPGLLIQAGRTDWGAWLCRLTLAGEDTAVQRQICAAFSTLSSPRLISGSEELTILRIND